MKLLHTKKFRYGSVSLTLTVIIIAAVILVNAIFTALAEKFLWYIDMTSEEIYTLSDEAIALLDSEAAAPFREADVTIIFCSDKDVLEGETLTRYMLYSALDIADRYDNVKIRYVDIYTNPSAVQQFTATQDIYAQSVIVTSGTEYRVFSWNTFFRYDSTGETIIGYDGEQRYVSALLSVTQAESPIACVTTNHGEIDSLTADSSILSLLHENGYELKNIDLTKEELPEDCRLVLVFDPQSDFVAGGLSEVDELKKLDDFLADGNSLMVFFDYETPVLRNFEEFLSEWGIAVSREGTANYLIKDADHSLTANGYTIKGDYVVDNGAGAKITAQLRADAYPKDVIFPYTSAIGLPEGWMLKQNTEDGFSVYSSTANGIVRSRYGVFTSFDSAEAYAGENKGADGPYYLMTMTSEYHAETQRNAYVLACSSTQFASAGALNRSYGNHSALSYASVVMGRTVIPVSLNCKYFADTEIDSITSKAANQYTVVLSVVPAAIIFIAGTYIMVRRKYA